MTRVALHMIMQNSHQERWASILTFRCKFISYQNQNAVLTQSYCGSKGCNFGHVMQLTQRCMYKPTLKSLGDTDRYWADHNALVRTAYSSATSPR